RTLLLLPYVPRPPTSHLFPYTTLFRSRAHGARARAQARCREDSAIPARRARLRACRSACDGISAAPDGASSWRAGLRACRAFRRSEEHTSELQSRENLVCRLLLEKKKN